VDRCKIQLCTDVLILWFSTFKGNASLTPVSYKYEAGHAWVMIDNPPVNATSRAVRSGLLDAVGRSVRDGCRTGMIICKGKTFVAGGDISEFGKPALEPHLPDVYQSIEQSPVIWASALHGTVLGGGFELAMACHVRVALGGTRFGLPEVNLGLVPGAGGTQRLPRLVGAELAADLASSGRLIDAQALLAAGGLDAVVDADLVEHTRLMLDTTTSQPMAVSERRVVPVAEDFFETFKLQAKKKSKGAIAPLLNVNAVQWSCDTEFSDGQKRERTLHLKLRDSDQSVALRHVFFAERSVSKPEVIKNVEPRQIDHVTVVGGGLMGAGIAASCLNAGFTVHLLEVDNKSVAAAKQRVRDLLDGALKRGKINKQRHEKQTEAFSCGSDYQAAAKTNIAIEAVFEDMAVKQQVFKKLNDTIRKSALLATNTSYLDPELIADGIGNPERIIGLHFFSPAHIMKLLEIVRTRATSASTLSTAFHFARRLGKVGVLSGVCDGFIGNRMLAAFRRQGDYLLADGATPAQVDAAMRSYGLPMGPYELQDLTGLQIGWANRKRLEPDRSPAERYVNIADKLCEQERFGQRTGRGWYRYKANDRTPIVDDEVTQLVKDYSTQHGIVRRSFTELEIQNSMIAVMANEGMRILEEGIAERPSDIDIVKIHGYGFPRWRGGPMHAAQVQGREVIVRWLSEADRQSPGSWVFAKHFGG